MVRKNLKIKGQLNFNTMFDKEIQEIELEKVLCTSYGEHYHMDNKIAQLYRNQEKILNAIKMLNENIVGPTRELNKERRSRAEIIYKNMR